MNNVRQRSNSIEPGVSTRYMVRVKCQGCRKSFSSETDYDQYDICRKCYHAACIGCMWIANQYNAELVDGTHYCKRCPEPPRRNDDRDENGEENFSEGNDEEDPGCSVYYAVRDGDMVAAAKVAASQADLTYALRLAVHHRDQDSMRALKGLGAVDYDWAMADAAWAGFTSGVVVAHEMGARDFPRALRAAESYPRVEELLRDLQQE